MTATYTVEGYVAAIGRRLPGHQFEHKTLRSGPLDLTVDLASVIPDAMASIRTRHGQDQTASLRYRIVIHEILRTADDAVVERGG